MSPTSDRAHAAEGSLRADALRLLAFQARPGTWTWFAGAPPGAGPAAPDGHPDLVIEIGGRVVYVELRSPHLGPLPAARRAWQAAARRRGAAVAAVRSLPELERLLAGLGVRLRRPGGLAAELARHATGRRIEHAEIETRATQSADRGRRGAPGAADAPDRGPAAP